MVACGAAQSEDESARPADEPRAVAAAPTEPAPPYDAPEGYFYGASDHILIWVVFYSRAFDVAEAAEIFACVPASTAPIPEG